MKIILAICILIAIWSASLIVRGYYIGIAGVILAVGIYVIARNIKNFPSILMRRTQARVDKSMIPTTMGDPDEELDDSEDDGVPFMDTRHTTRRRGPQFRRVGMNDKEADEAAATGEEYHGYTDVNEVTRSLVDRDAQAVILEQIREIREMMKSGELDLATGRKMLRNIQSQGRKTTKKKPTQRIIYVAPKSSRHRDDFNLK